MCDFWSSSHEDPLELAPLLLPELPVDDRQLAEDLTLRGIAVEGIFDLGAHGSLFEMDITTNRVDAMNHYGIAREIAAIYNLPLTTDTN